MFSEKQIEKIKKKETPFYVYDLNLLQKTLIELNREAGSFKIHYALKSKFKPKTS